MSLECPLAADPVSGFPRVSGDEPDLNARRLAREAFSPRERG